MTKSLSTRQFAMIKRVAQNVNPLVTKKQKLRDKMHQLIEEIDAIEKEITGHEMGVISLTGGYTSSDLITKRMEDTGKVDANNRPIKTPKYEPSGLVAYNETTHMYEFPEYENPLYSVEEFNAAIEEEFQNSNIDNLPL